MAQDPLGFQKNYFEIHRINQQHVYHMGIVDAKSKNLVKPEDAAIGTAFAVSKEGHFLTAYHTVKREYDAILAGKRLLAVKGTHGYGVQTEPAYQVDVVERYPNSDFLLLRSGVKRNGHVKLVATKVPLGMSVATIGYPLSRYDEDKEKVEVGKRMVAAMVSAANDHDGVHEVELDKHLTHGHSGGPVFGLGGPCVAMATGYKRGWHEVEEARVVDGKLLKERKMLFMPTQFSTASLISNVAGYISKHGVPVVMDKDRFPESPEQA